MFSDNQYFNSLTDTMTHDSSRPSRLLKSGGDEAVVYDTASGGTHYLKPLTLALYLTCRDHPDYSSAELAVALTTSLEVAATPQFQKQTEDALTSLRKIGQLESA